MLKKTVLFSILIVVIALFAFLSIKISDHNLDLKPNLDNTNWDWPKRYRTSKDFLSAELVSLQGLRDLNASASSQFSEKGFGLILKSIPAKKVVVIDLREEYHGFVDGMPVNWIKFPNNDGNIGKPVQEILKEEKKYLHSAKHTSLQLPLPLDKKEKKNIHSQPIAHISLKGDVKTEQELVENYGCSYLRLPVTDHLPPSRETVDKFIHVVNSLQQDSWLHVHCKGGSGRSTTFFAMYDMLFNAKKVPFAEILLRHAFLGGKDLTIMSSEPYKQHYAKKRLAFIQKFYDYCTSVDPKEVSWSEWLQRNSLMTCQNSKEQNCLE